MSKTKRYMQLSILLFAIFAGCTTASSIDQQVSTVAVWDLENFNPAEGPGLDMGELLAAKVIETLSESGTYELVEREQLILALEEIDLSTTLPVDEETRLRIGHICGARFMVFGSYVVIGKVMRLDLRLVEVETGKVVKAAQKTTSAGNLNSWLKIAREAAQELIPI